MRSRAYQERHQRLLAAARKEIVERGFSYSSIQRICMESGVGIGTYYSHFKGKKNEILDAIVRPEFARVNAIEKKDVTRVALIRSIAEAAGDESVRLRHIWHDVALYRGPATPDVAELWWKQLTRITELIREVRKKERIVDPMLSASEAAWLILLLMRDRDTSRLRGQDSARGFLDRAVNAAIVGSAPTGSRPVAMRAGRRTRRGSL